MQLENINIEKHHVPPSAASEFQRITPIRRFASDQHSMISLQDRSQSLSGNFVVVAQR